MRQQDLRQSPQYHNFMRSLGWQVIDGAFIKKMPILPFSFVKIQRTDQQPSLAFLKKYRPIFISYEPLDSVKTPSGFRPATPLLPSKTVWLDLTRSQPQLLRAMHPKTRYNIKKHRLPNLVKITCGDQVTEKKLKDFYQIYQQNSHRQKFWGLNFNQLNSLINAFRGNSYLLVVRRMAKPGGPPKRDPLWVFLGERRRQGLTNNIVAGLLILIHDRVAYYSHNAATTEGRRMFAPTLLAWEAIKLAKKLNCVRFDFEGITDDRWPLTQKWSGFTRFKLGFGGKVVTYPGNFVKWSLPWK